jgi:hypothetical protein
VLEKRPESIKRADVRERPGLKDELTRLSDPAKCEPVEGI